MCSHCTSGTRSRCRGNCAPRFRHNQSDRRRRRRRTVARCRILDGEVGDRQLGEADDAAVGRGGITWTGRRRGGATAAGGRAGGAAADPRGGRAVAATGRPSGGGVAEQEPPTRMKGRRGSGAWTWRRSGGGSWRRRRRGGGALRCVAHDEEVTPGPWDREGWPRGKIVDRVRHLLVGFQMAQGRFPCGLSALGKGRDSCFRTRIFFMAQLTKCTISTMNGWSFAFNREAAGTIERINPKK